MTEDDVFNALKYRTYNAGIRRYEWHNSDRQPHRIDGPAIEYNYGRKYWYIRGYIQF